MPQRCSHTGVIQAVSSCGVSAILRLMLPTPSLLLSFSLSLSLTSAPLLASPSAGPRIPLHPASRCETLGEDTRGHAFCRRRGQHAATENVRLVGLERKGEEQRTRRAAEGNSACPGRASECCRRCSGQRRK